jgi:hypothetical protein
VSIVFGVGQPAIGTMPGSLSVPWLGPPFGPSCWHGVGQPAAHTARPKSAFTGTVPSLEPSLWSRVVGVGHPHNITKSFRSFDRSGFSARFAWPPPVPSLLCAVGHPIKPLSDMRCAEARSADIECPDGVTRSFQVCRYKVEPTEAVFACNLLAKDEARSALLNEPVERGP